MEDNESNIKHIILFSGALAGVGGAERLIFEEARYFLYVGMDTHVWTFNFRNEVLFNNYYNVAVTQIGRRVGSKDLLTNIFQEILNIYKLRRELDKVKPDTIISTSAWDCVPLYFATLFTNYSYVTHIHGTIFWFKNDLLKYAWIHRKVFNEIRNSVIGHREFISISQPKSSLSRNLIKEFYATAIYLGVRKAKKIFVLSNQMKWEVNKLYGKDAMVLKGAFPKEILKYKPKRDIKKKLGLSSKIVILNVNRLDPRKRVDLLIKAFEKISDKFDNSVLIIGGVGPEEGNLKALASELDIQDRVNFVGYIKEEELWDYIACCDVFVHPNWADFAIAAYEPLALQKKVVWSTEMEVDQHLASNKHIFSANPTVSDFAQAIDKALTTEVKGFDDLSMYTWDNYSKSIAESIAKMIDT